MAAAKLVSSEREGRELFAVYLRYSLNGVISVSTFF
jgi:hypothetical protein